MPKFYLPGYIITRSTSIMTASTRLFPTYKSARQALSILPNSKEFVIRKATVQIGEAVDFEYIDKNLINKGDFT